MSKQRSLLVFLKRNKNDQDSGINKDKGVPDGEEASSSSKPDPDITEPMPKKSKPDLSRKFQPDWLKQHPWLGYDKEKNVMFCVICKSANMENIMSTGTDNFRTSTLSRHVKLAEHQTLILGKSLQNSTASAFNKTYELEAKGVVTAMKAAYYIVKEHLPLAKFNSLITLFKNVKAENIQHLQSGKIQYDSSYTMDEFIDAINEKFVIDTNAKLKSATVMSLLCDESTDIATHKKLALWARVIDINGDNPNPETIFITDKFIPKGDGETIANVIKTELSERGVPMSKVLGLGSDGASVMTGTNKGVTGLLMRENPLLINVHCIAHRVALITSQTSQSFPTLKDFQQTLTNLFYYFCKSSNKTQKLEEIQKVLELSVLKIKEIHEVRWLSFYDALSSVFRSLPALLSYFEGIDKSKDPKGEGIARKVATKRFIYLTCLLLDILAPIMVLSQKFQEQNLDPSMVKVHIDTCKSDLLKIRDNVDTEGYLPKSYSEINEVDKTYKGFCISMNEPSNIKVKYIDALISSIDKRFPQIDILNAFGILGLRPISFLSDSQLECWGNDQINKLCNHFGTSGEHRYKSDDGSSQTVYCEPFIDPKKVMEEWLVCKRVVLQQLYPRDNMLILWQLIMKYHSKDFPNLILLAAVALTCPTNTADCERSFSVQNYITTHRRASMSPEKCDKLMRINICGPPIGDMDFLSAAHIWCKKKDRYLFKSTSN